MDKLTELKAQAFDLIANIEFLQAKLRECNQAIAQLIKEKQDQENGQSNTGNNN